MSAAKPFVRAIVVTAGRPGYLAETLTAVAAQDRKVDAWHLVVVEGRRTSGKDLGIPSGLGIPVTRVSASTFGEAVSRLLGENPGGDEWLWLLHDDSAPERSALRHLLAATAKRRRAGVVGPAQVGWDDSRSLMSVGTTISPSGRRLNTVDQDDLDQGQHEGREDVLAVGLAGALVSRPAWERLGGTDPAYGPFGDSADFCRRAWRAGYDVVVVPRARVRHAQASLYSRPDASESPRSARATQAARRASEWYHGLAWARRRAVAPIALWAFVSSLGRGALRLAAAEPRLAWAEFRVPGLLFARIRSLPASRRTVTAAGTVPIERRLLASVADVLGYVRTRELGSYEAWRAENRPNDVQRAEIKTLKTRRRWALAGVALALVVISVALYGTWLAPLMRGDMLVGSAMGVSDVPVADLVARSWTGWSDAGFGTSAIDGSFAALMVPLGLVPGGLAMGVGLLLAFAPVWAGLAAWFAAGGATRSVVARGTLAVAWGVWPTLTASVASGRVGSVIVHILLPLFALALVRAVALQRRDRLGDGHDFPVSRLPSPQAAAAAAVLGAAVTVAAPILLAPFVLIVLALASVAWRNAGRVLAIALPALILHGPALVSTWQHRAGERWWWLLVREPGPALSSDQTSPWDLLWGVAQAPPPWPAATETGNLVLTYLAGVAVVLAAIVALASGRAPWAVRAGWLVAALGLAAAIVAQRTAAVASGGDAVPEANGWPGPGLSVMAVGLFLAVAAALGGSRHRVGTVAAPTAAPRPVGRGALVVVGFALVAAHVVATAWPGRDFGGDVHPSAVTVLPLVADLELRSAPETRALVMWERDDGTIAYQVLSGDGFSALAGRSYPETTARDPGGADAIRAAAIAGAVADLAGSGAAAAITLREWGIGVVVVAPGSSTLEAALLRVGDLALIGASDLGASWRVRPGTGARDEGKVARAWIEGGDGARFALDSDPAGLVATIPDAEHLRRLVLATPADSRWHATLDGTPLKPVGNTDRQEFLLGTSGGHVEVEFHDRGYRAWWWAGVVSVLWAALGAVPLRDRAYRRERR